MFLTVYVFGRGIEKRNNVFRLREVLMMVATVELDASHLGFVFLNIDYFLNRILKVK